MEVNVWNVKTDTDGDWLVVEGDAVPINLYPQGTYYFGADEVYLFHMGLMQRMSASHDKYNPEDLVRGVTLDTEIAPQLFRKLKSVASLIDIAKEIDDFQSIGVQCRETLIELGNHIYEPHMAGVDEQPQASNFKKKSELFTQFYLTGAENSDYRSIIKKLTESTWEYACKITHSSTATFYEASTCVMLCTSLVGVFENIMQKVFDPISQYKCIKCKSKRLTIDKDVSDEMGMMGWKQDLSRIILGIDLTKYFQQRRWKSLQIQRKDKIGKIVSQVMENYADRKESDVFATLAKQIVHFKSDITTSMGLPAPLMGLFNLLQFGSIGEEEQTIAEIVQGMYYEGYDFIHFCSLSIPAMLVEVIVRLGYAIKRIKEGNRMLDSIPFSLNREKHPKLATMLFMAHSGATAINAGKVYFSKNPMAINYLQWIAFAKYSYKQIKRVLLEKPEARDAYISGKLYDDLKGTCFMIDKCFEDFTSEYIVIFDDH